MIMLYDVLLGYYVPSFFEMHIDTDADDLTINKLSIRDITILFHEYIHFLQDITTFYGLNGIYVHSEYLHSVVNRIYKIDEPFFRVPFKIEDNNDNVILNKKIVAITLGDTSSLTRFEIKTIIESNAPLLIKNDYMDEIPEVMIQTKQDDYISFGAKAIMENMADLLERLCSPRGYQKSHEYPYYAAEKVAAYYSTDFASNPLYVLALCDMSLQSSNPGACYVRILKGIKNGDIQFTKPEDIYDYFYKQIGEMGDGITKSYFLQSFMRMLSLVQASLKSYFVGLPQMESYYEWIDSIITFSIDWRENDRYFLLKMASCNELSKNGCWGKAIHDIGTPLMSNNHVGHFFKVPRNNYKGDMDVEYIKAINEVRKVFEEESFSCSMYEWCKNSKDSTPNALCTFAPWRKYREQRLCPFALVWKHWHLAGRIPSSIDITL